LLALTFLGFSSLSFLFYCLPLFRFLATTLFVAPLRVRTLFLVLNPHPLFDTTFRDGFRVKPPFAHSF
jgi:hypothetical protein